MKNEILPTPAAPRSPSRRLWVGVSFVGPLKKQECAVFRHTGTPTAETTPQFSSVIGPFRTKRGAEYMARFSGGRSLCVSDAERLAAIHAGQSAACAAYSAHLDREIRK